MRDETWLAAFEDELRARGLGAAERAEVVVELVAARVVALLCWRRRWWWCPGPSSPWSSAAGPGRAPWRSRATAAPPVPRSPPSRRAPAG